MKKHTRNTMLLCCSQRAPKYLAWAGWVWLVVAAAVLDGRAQQASTMLSYPDFYEVVIEHHPVVKQAGLLPQEAQAELLQAKGGFDPKLGVVFDRKAFKGADYYNRFDGVIKVPSWIGDLKMGYENNSGGKLRSEESPQLLYAGITVPIGQGLVIDARRNTLRQAQLFQQIAQAEQVKLINKVVFSAAKDYWEWYYVYQQYEQFRIGYELARVRFEGIRRRAQLGDLAAVDSTEAKIVMQDRLVMLSQAEVELQNMRLIVSNYLWDANGQPRELGTEVVPQYRRDANVTAETLQTLLSRARQQHPEILKFDFKIKQLGFEERFRREMLKPQIDFTFNFLSEPLKVQTDGIANAFLTNNHKFNVTLSQPLFLRKERGKLQQVRIKQRDALYGRQQTSREISNAVQAAYNEVRAIERQIVVQTDAVRNQEILLSAEQRKFDIGETTVFLVQTRETKLIEMRVKLAAMQAKYEKAVASLLYESGISAL
jgi:outer membrane protein